MSTEVVSELADDEPPRADAVAAPSSALQRADAVAAPSSALQRDVAGRARDRAADARDRAADLRDLEAQADDAISQRQFDVSDRVRPRSGREIIARAALERRRANADRAAAAEQRVLAARDRAQAAHDRRLAAADRAASVHDLQQAAPGELTGLVRGPIALALLQRDVDRAHRTGTRLSVAVVDVDEQGGATAAQDVACALLARVRCYDLVMTGVRGEAIACALSGVALAAARSRVDAACRELAAAGVAVRVGYAQLEAHDRAPTLLGRAHASALVDCERSAI